MIINCDTGEGLGNEERLMPYIQAANIACGYHAGDISTMQAVISLCCDFNVAIGAHPSFYDRENFGRTELSLPPDEIYQLVAHQLLLLSEVAQSFDRKLQHVKPHGALYNMSARDQSLATLIAQAVKDFDDDLVLYGLAGSHSIAAAKKIGLRTASEAFADRSYQDDGSLTPRSHPAAMISDTRQVVAQVSEMIGHKRVTTITGKKIPIDADTICIHGDGPHAVEFAKAIAAVLHP